MANTNDYSSNFNTYFVDGTNICYWQDTSYPSLNALLQLMIALKREKGKSFYCVFDANTHYKLPENEKEIYRKLLTNKDFIYQVAGGKRADDFVLELADAYNAPVISNDNYNDPKYDKYKWKSREAVPTRLFMGEVLPVLGNQHLILSDLDIHVILKESTEELYDILVEMIKPEQEKFFGKIRFFNGNEGWGRISYETDVFFHKSSILQQRELGVGQNVEFVLGENEKGLFAQSIVPTEAPAQGKMYTGLVELYDDQKLLGVIKVNGTDQKVFFYKSYFLEESQEDIKIGLPVEFVIGKNSKGACAKEISVSRTGLLIKKLEDKVQNLEQVVKSKENTIQQLRSRKDRSNAGEESSSKDNRDRSQNKQQAASTNGKATSNKEQAPNNNRKATNNQNGKAANLNGKPKQGANKRTSNDQNRKENAPQKDRSTASNKKNANAPKKEPLKLVNPKSGSSKNEKVAPVNNKAKDNPPKNEKAAPVNNKAKDNPPKNEKAAPVNNKAKDNPPKNEKAAPVNNKAKDNPPKNEKAAIIKPSEKAPAAPVKKAPVVKKEKAVTPPKKETSKKPTSSGIIYLKKKPAKQTETPKEKPATMAKPTAKKTTAPAPKEKAQPVKKTTAPKEKAQPMAKKTTAPKEKAQPTAKKTTAPKEKAQPAAKKTTAPKEKAQPAAKKTTAPKEKAQPAAKKTTAPKEKAQPAAKKTTAPKEKVQPAAKKTATPKEKAQPAAKKTATTKKKASTKKKEEAVPATASTTKKKAASTKKKAAASSKLNVADLQLPTAELRQGWWNSLDTEWKKAFNVVLGNGEKATKVSDDSIQSILKSERIGFYRTSKNKLSFKLTNLKGLVYLTNLRNINVAGHAIDSIKPITHLKNLKVLNCSGNPLSDEDKKQLEGMKINNLKV